MTRLDAVNFISHGIAKAPGRRRARAGRPRPAGPRERGEGEEPRGKKPGRTPSDLLRQPQQEGEQGKIDPLIGRDQVERTIQILCRRTKNNPLYGRPGVGKTAIAEGWPSASSRATCRRCC
jgi:ATP-dependent Clp protease ATP-binding subunit ClpA